MADSRNKGAAFEREIVHRLNDFFVDQDIIFDCKRNLSQYQIKNLTDIEIPYHAIECKFYKEGWWWKDEWWHQACDSCANKIPVLVYKFNRKGVRVCLPVYAINTDLEKNNELTTVLTFDDWLSILKFNWDIYGRLGFDATA